MGELRRKVKLKEERNLPPAETAIRHAETTNLEISRRSLLSVLLLLTAVIITIVVFFSLAPPNHKILEGFPSLPDFPCSSTLSVPFLLRGVAPSWLGGRHDVLGTTRALWYCLEDYQHLHPVYTFSSYSIMYISLQTFAIPGPLVLSILAGAIYPFLTAQIVVAFCATTGACLCYGLSYLLGTSFVYRFFPVMLKQFKEKIQSNESNLFYYLLFLRFTPLIPNWFVNISSPIVGVPFKYFFLATFLGATLKNTTMALNTQTESNGTYWNFLILFMLQFVALLPTLFKKKIEKYDTKKL